jgi:hypothetical protein
MSLKKQKKNLINKGHYLELMDRLHVAMSMIDEHILTHPLTQNNPDIEKSVSKAIHKLWNAYQLVGNKEDSYENENNAH